MATLASLSTVVGTTGRGQAAVGLIIASSPIFRILEETSGWESQPYEFPYVTAASTATAEPRALNSDFDVDIEGPAPKNLGTQALYGFSTAKDIVFELDAAKGLGDTESRIIKKHNANLRKFGKSFANELFIAENVASPANNRMDGLRKISATLPGFGVSRTQNADSDVLDVTTAEGLIALHDLLFETRALVEEPNALVVNHTLGARIEWLAREYRVLGTETVFGRPTPSFDGIPIIKVSEGAVPNDEPSGNATPVANTTSFYWLGLGEGRLSLATNSGVYYREWEHTPQGEKSKELTAIHARWKCEDENSILRVRRIKAVK
jgi:hypothetical protein